MSNMLVNSSTSLTQSNSTFASFSVRYLEILKNNLHCFVILLHIILTFCQKSDLTNSTCLSAQVLVLFNGNGEE